MTPPEAGAFFGIPLLAAAARWGRTRLHERADTTRTNGRGGLGLVLLFRPLLQKEGERW